MEVSVPALPTILMAVSDAGVPPLAGPSGDVPGPLLCPAIRGCPAALPDAPMRLTAPATSAAAAAAAANASQGDLPIRSDPVGCCRSRRAATVGRGAARPETAGPGTRAAPCPAAAATPVAI